METTTRLVCPVHQMPDCSPLLNGCSLVNQMHRDYADVSPEDLIQRLKLAEDTCRMFGWSAGFAKTPREKAAYMLWVRWVNAVGGGDGPALSPKNYPNLSDDEVAALADERDAIRASVLRRLVAVDSVD